MTFLAWCNSCRKIVELSECSYDPDAGLHYCDTCVSKRNPQRPSWDSICMDIATKLSHRSTCLTPDRQVGCVIVAPDYSEIPAWGYNGGASGSPDPCDYDPSVERGSRCTCAHAEMNALTKLGTHRGDNLVMYVTLSPCKLCATLIINSKAIGEVVYRDEYRDTSPIFRLEAAGIRVRTLRS